MIALLLVVVGIAIMVGKDDLAMKTAKALVGLVVVLSFGPGLVASIDTGDVSLGCGGTGAASEVASVAGLVVLLAGVGIALWRARGLLAKRREEDARRWGSPRDRSMPSAPANDETGRGEDLP